MTWREEKKGEADRMGGGGGGAEGGGGESGYPDK